MTNGYPGQPSNFLLEEKRLVPWLFSEFFTLGTPLCSQMPTYTPWQKSPPSLLLKHPFNSAHTSCSHLFCSRRKTRMSGVIKKVWRVAGSRRILQRGSILGFVLEVLCTGPHNARALGNGVHSCFVHKYRHGMPRRGRNSIGDSGDVRTRRYIFISGALGSRVEVYHYRLEYFIRSPEMQSFVSRHLARTRPNWRFLERQHEGCCSYCGGSSSLHRCSK